MSIQRWLLNLPHMIRHPDGAYVLYSDHVAAVEAAYRRGHDDAAETYEPMFKAGREQAIHDCIAAVQDMPEPWPIAVPHALPKFNVLAALRALLKDGAE